MSRRSPPSLALSSVPGATLLVAGVGIALVVAILWAAQTLLMPLAFSMVLAVVLTPIVRGLERRRFPRPLAVVVTMATLLSLLVAGASLMVVQIGELAAETGNYAVAVREKLQALRSGEGALERLEQSVATVSAELDDPGPEQVEAPAVRVVTDRLSAFDVLRETLGPLIEPAASAVLVLVLVAFMLARREDIRDRLIRLAGSHQVTMTTRLLDDVSSGVSRFLLVQSLINTVVGVLVALGLWAIGVPYPVLWGALTVVLRFVPYVGSIVAMMLPVALAFATSVGWTSTLQTVALFVVLDLIFAYFVEPLVIGRHVGVSSLALLISAVFWTWIWGPAGLAVATPLTLCLAVAGRHVPGLELLGIILGDDRPLPSSVGYYQRLIARDPDEAAQIVQRERESLGDARVRAEILLPALAKAARDQARAEITEEDAAFVTTTTLVWLEEPAS